MTSIIFFIFFFQAEDGIRDYKVTGVQTCALPISDRANRPLKLCRERRDEIPDGGGEHGRHDQWEEERISADVASIRRRRRAPCVRLRPIASGPSPGSGRPRGRDVRVPEKKKTRLRAVAYPRRGEFCPENGGEGAPQMGDLRVTSTVIGPAIRGATKSSNQKKLTAVNYSMEPRAVNPAHVGSTRLEDHRGSRQARRRGHHPPACVSSGVRRRAARALRRKPPRGAGASPERRHPDDDLTAGRELRH